MANKRDLKKFVRNTCGALAAEIIFARAAFPSIEGKKVQEIVTDIARLQGDTLTKASISFDKSPRDFETRAAYHKARADYYNKAYTKLLDNFDEAVLAIVKNMNAALPADVKAEIKKVAAE